MRLTPLNTRQTDGAQIVAMATAKGGGKLTN